LKRTAFPLLAAFSLLIAAKAPEERMITYKMKPVREADGTTSLLVSMRFRGDADGETSLEMPSSWAGSDELWRHIGSVRVRGAKQTTGYIDAPTIRHRPGKKLEIRYKIASAWQEDPGFAYQRGRPMVRPDWFFFHGESVFALPQGREASPARFRWAKLPKGWKVASDLDHLRRYPSTAANLINSVGIGGKELRVVERQVGRAPLRVAVLGRWQFEPEQLADIVEPIVKAGDAYWGEESTPFLVALAPLGDVEMGLHYTGTGRTDAFSIASTGAFPLEEAPRFLGHEYMHSWVPIMLGMMPAVDDSRDYWFSEGFSDYLAGKVLLRAGLWTLDDFVADKNRVLLRYGISPARRATDTDVAEGIWFDRNIQQLNYDRGHLLAAKFDAEITARSGGRERLGDILRAQRRIADGNLELATALFRKVLLERTGIDAQADVDRYARRGEFLELPQDIFAGCAGIVTQKRRGFDRGFDSSATRIGDGIIAGVDPAGPAFAAGMRDGMRLVRREAGVVGDSSVEMAYRVADPAGERIVRYLPEGKEEHAVQQMVLTAEAPEEKARCLRWFAEMPG
jgi:predicted metalloprotease with PDZ domain